MRGDTFDPARHVQGREVKAITRHLLEVRRRDGMWHGQVIVDI
ncbi:MAG: archease [Candidatus Omnitrophica bacterium]|nr:archease [Candidatus Omnitrophota bacterium]